MNIRIDSVEMDDLNLTEPQLRFDLALGLFADDRVSLGKAARIAGVGVVEFQRGLAARHIPLHYGVEEFHEDLKTLEELSRR